MKVVFKVLVQRPGAGDLEQGAIHQKGDTADKVFWGQILESFLVMLRSCTCFFREIRSQQGIWRKGVMEPSLYFRNIGQD